MKKQQRGKGEGKEIKPKETKRYETNAIDKAYLHKQRSSTEHRTQQNDDYDDDDDDIVGNTQSDAYNKQRTGEGQGTGLLCATTPTSKAAVYFRTAAEAIATATDASVRNEIKNQ